MLKILWVEDEYSEQKQVSWFNNRSVCLKTSFDEAENAINHCLTQFDLIVLDINLEKSEHTDKVKELAKQFSITEQAFLQESGMNLFLNLLEHGFPKQQIIFLTANADINICRIDELREANNQEDYDGFDEILGVIRNELSEETGNKCSELIKADDIEGLCQYLENYFNDLNDGGINNTYNRFCEAYRRCRIEPPKAINKSLNEAKQHLNHWLENHERNDYLILRRGVIEGCQYLKKLPEDQLRFKEFIKESEKQPSIDDIRDYLDVLANFLPLREPENTASLYKLFIRTLAHEWEAAEPKILDRQNELFAFSWIMKMTRNWLAHSKVFEQLTAEDVAYLFIVNMRAMFDLGDQLLAYESHLLSLFSAPITADEMKDKAGDNPRKRNDRNPTGRELPLVENYAALLKKTGNTWQAINFHDALNNLQKNKGKESDSNFLIQGLYQTFWFLTSSGGVYIPANDEQVKDFAVLNYQFKHFDYQKSQFLLELARHIYNLSFPKSEKSCLPNSPHNLT